ncbi:molybdopterin-dependent oxidoreductase [Bradyrhizobium sp. NP1]|uniref:molybdopterin-dependent oxidoreductase n=1 Tax=Bradyrhizobium sp. NP1 TaxID=3049772 RepID=UPI0025A5CD79|nr:molybdopterin-dependent oxidoreductase [Bradyrhizobium sp. NP1]WJR76692.1 molybdopterin-dependent oxidoreductase [Bradyrhizobium sp. NP1]
MAEKIYTSCTLDCPDGCGIVAHVEDGRVIRLEGHPDHEFTRGYLCAKTYRFPRRLYSAERQLYPLARADGTIHSPWVRIEWDDALDRIAAGIEALKQSDGPLSIMHYQRTGSWGATKKLSHRFWNLLGGVTTTSGSLCSGAARAGQKLDFGTRLGHDPSDMLNSRLVVLWGRNPLATNLHVVPLLKSVREQGGRVILVDPVRSESATLCDQHIQPRVASDAALALALAKIILAEGLEDKAFIAHHTHGFAGYCKLIERHSLEGLSAACGIAIPDLQCVAREYATTRPASILLGWGLNKYKNSAEIFRCVDALAAICGQIGVAGGGVSHGFDTQRLFDKSLDASDRASHHRAIPEPLLGRGLLEAKDPPIRMLFVNGGNPVNQSPNSNLVARALRQLECVVVVDSFLTDTTDYAHLFLPTTTFLEEEDALVSWGHNILGGVNAAIPPLGESRSDLRIYQDLAARLGLAEEMAGTPRQWLERILAPLTKKGVSVDELMKGPVRCPVAPLVPFSDRRFPTPSGRFEFVTDVDIVPRVDADFPLTFVTNFSKKWLLSQMLETEHPKTASIRVGEEAARKAGIANGEIALLRSAVGELRVEVLVDPRVGADMVIMPVGTWMKRGGGANVLTEDVMSNFGEMAAYGETRVRLEPIARASGPEEGASVTPLASDWQMTQ